MIPRKIDKSNSGINNYGYLKRLCNTVPKCRFIHKIISHRCSHGLGPPDSSLGNVISLRPARRLN